MIFLGARLVSDFLSTRVPKRCQFRSASQFSKIDKVSLLLPVVKIIFDRAYHNGN